jgi:Ser/Thr protein kinase RdoA (MazF antagonist)
MMICDDIPAEECAEMEFSAANELDTLFKKSPGYGVVEPLERMGSLLIFEHIAGITPVIALRVAALDEAISIMRRLGLWFAKLHEASKKGKQTGGLAGRFEAMMSWSKHQKRHPTVGQALSYLETRLPESEPNSSRYCRLHGDAKPENFLIEGDRVVGIDIGWRFLQLPENDLAQFLTQYELSVCGFFGNMDKSRRQALEDAFLDGYRSSIIVDESILAWLRVYFLLHLWFSSRETSMLHRLRWDIVFRRRMDCLLLELP